MTNAPYAGQEEMGMRQEPRTSVLAITSLVLALICFIPALGLLAVLLGIFAMIGISGSNGRKKGMGLAAAGIVIGLVVSVLWGAFFYGASQIANGAGKFVLQPMDTALTSMEAGNYAAARAPMTASASAAITDERMADFVAEYKADVGAYQHGPSGIIEWFTTSMELGPEMSNINSAQTTYPNLKGRLIPLPATFDSGLHLVCVVVPNMGGNKSANAVPVENIVIFGTNGQQHWLVDPAAPAAPAATPSGSPAPAAPPPSQPTPSQPVPSDGPTPSGGG